MIMKRAIAMMVVSCMLFAGIAIIMPTASAYPEEAPRVQTLWAGQHINVGTVEVWTDGDAIHVEYKIKAPWKMTQSHLMVANDLSLIPQTAKGNAIPGKFTWGESYNPGVSGDEFIISRSGNHLNIGWVYIAAHAVVTNPCGGSETAWAQGCLINEDSHGKGRGSWATYFTYEINGHY